VIEQWFGEPWDDPRLEGKPRGGTPTGKECMHCGKGIKAGDQGVQMYATQQWGSGEKTLAPVHRDCLADWLSGEGSSPS
jgi:hypothetical protein